MVYKKRILAFFISFILCFNVIFNTNIKQAKAEVVTASSVAVVMGTAVIIASLANIDYSELAYITQKVVETLSDTAVNAISSAYKMGTSVMEIGKDIVREVKEAYYTVVNNLTTEPIYVSSINGFNAVNMNLKYGNYYNFNIINYSVGSSFVLTNNNHSVNLGYAITDNGRTYATINGEKAITYREYTFGNKIVRYINNPNLLRPNVTDVDIFYVPFVNNIDGKQGFVLLQTMAKGYTEVGRFEFLDDVAVSTVLTKPVEKDVNDVLVGVGTVAIPKPAEDVISAVDSTTTTITDVATSGGNNGNNGDNGDGNGINLKPLANLGIALKNVFPFCLVFTVGDIISVLDAEPQVPVWVIDVPEQMVGGGQIVIDFSAFDKLAVIVRFFVIIIVVVALIFITRRII